MMDKQSGIRYRWVGNLEEYLNVTMDGEEAPCHDLVRWMHSKAKQGFDLHEYFREVYNLGFDIRTEVPRGFLDFLMEEGDVAVFADKAQAA